MNRFYRPKMFTPEQAAGLLGVGLPTDNPDAECTARQAAALERLAVAVPPRFGFDRASALLSSLCGRIDGGLCSLRQLAWLVSRGIPVEEAREVPFADASEFISEARTR